MSVPTGDESPYARERAFAIEAVLAAGAVVRDLYDRAAAETYTKDDGSAVTDADLASDQILRQMLAEHFPADPILTEEGVDDSDRLASSRVWIADPIDGTDQFIRRTGDFDVLLSLVVGGRPVVAAAINPPTGMVCVAEAGQGAWLRDGEEDELRPFCLSPVTDRTPVRLASSTWFGAPQNQTLLERIAVRVDPADISTIPIGFSPRVFLPGRGIDAFVGIKTGSDQMMAWEWDFATADLFIHEAGGIVTDLAGHPYRYNQPDPRARGGLIAARDPETHQRLLRAIQHERPGILSGSS